jgi:hypothetical protein
MAKFGSFFRRLFSPNPSDDHKSSSALTPESRKNVVIIPPSSPSSLPISKLTTMTTRSCTTSPCVVPKQTTLNVENTNETSKSNYLSSDIIKVNIRRLSAPLIIHTSSHHHPQYPSTIVNESTEKALLSSLQRSSLSSSTTTTTAHPNHSIHSLITSSPGGGGGGSSGSSSSRPNVRSASFNLSTSPSSLSNNLVNNISSTSGRWREILFLL